MLITNGTPRCSATCAMAAAAPESNGPTRTLAPSWISRSALVLAVSTFDSKSAFISSISTPSMSLITPGARSAPFWHDWPMKLRYPERGRITPTRSFCDCARTMLNGLARVASPAAASAVLKLRRFMSSSLAVRYSKRAMRATRKAGFGPMDVGVERGAGGTLYLRSPHALAAYPARLTERLDYWAQAAPGRVLLAQRDGAGWRTLTYAQA